MSAAAPRKGVLFLMMQPPQHLEEEYNDWYDTEHLPERRGIPGFESMRRYVQMSPGPRTYAAVYDIAHVKALETPEYRKLFNLSPWTKRLMRRIPRYRYFGEQVHPGDTITAPTSHLTVLRFTGLTRDAEASVVAGTEKSFSPQPEVVQRRVYAQEQDSGTCDYLVLVGSFSPTPPCIDAAAFGAAAARLDFMATFVPHGIGAQWEKAI